MPLLTANEVAERLGVKLPTIYAYVSRGLLDSHAWSDRTSRFDSRQVEQLALRGRPRVSSQETSINLLINSGLTSLSETGLSYRGHRVDDLVERHTFEEVAELLWTGTLSAGPHRPWSAAPVSLLRSFVPADLPTDQQVRVICALMTPSPVRWHAPETAAVADEARALVATVVDALALVGTPTGSTLVVGDRRLRGTVAARLWPRLTAARANTERVALLNTALIVIADHELATSTLAVRVAASTLASPSASVLAGLGAMQGSLHGGASRLVRELLLDAAERGASTAVRSRLVAGERIAGFGHRVYAGIDPRASLLLDQMARCMPRHRYLVVAHDVIAETADRIGKAPNIDLALAAFELAADMKPNSAETIFTVGRLAGWVAHAIEEYSEAPLRFRARAHYTGPTTGTVRSRRP